MEIILKLFLFSNKLKAKVIKDFKSYNFSDNDVYDDFEAEMEEASNLDQVVMEINGEILKLTLPTSGLLINDCRKYFRNILDNCSQLTCTKNEILYALCFFADLFEYDPF